MFENYYCMANMTIEELPDTYMDKIRIKMPAKQYMAVRMKQVKS